MKRFIMAVCAIASAATMLAQSYQVVVTTNDGERKVFATDDVSDIKFTNDRTGEMDNCMVDEFFYAVSYSAMMNLHFVQMRGANDHHIIEATFKAFAKALDMATTVDCRINGVLSTKGTI